MEQEPQVKDLSKFSPIKLTEKADIYWVLLRVLNIRNEVCKKRKEVENRINSKNDSETKALIHNLTVLIVNLGELKDFSKGMSYQNKKTKIESINAKYKKLLEIDHNILPLQSYDLPDVCVSYEMHKGIKERLEKIGR